ncbi:sigma-70 family RNA polymerase sigma factor [Streptomyces sp. HNM0574]|uniref:sigma-70 family RNA polymerase sigma factor n=1 Tax=Streptomyces sp. HNM0574 TaxID=2714954 RepID=UPI003216D50C
MAGERGGCACGEPEGGPGFADALLRTVFDGYRPALLRYVGRLTYGDSHRAEDIVQETLLRAWLRADRLTFAGPGTPDGHEGHEGSAEPRAEPGLGPWLFTVARNLAVDFHRRERAVPVGTTPEEDGGRVPATDDPADSVVDRYVVARALARVSPEHRAVLVLTHLLGCSGAETSRALGIPRGTVKSRTHYALLAIRRELGLAEEPAAQARIPAQRAPAERQSRAPDVGAPARRPAAHTVTPGPGNVVA